MRTLSESSPRSVPGTESSFVVPPFWSPDSSFLAWASGGPLKKISLSGGTPQTICEITPNAVGGSWNRDDVTAGHARRLFTAPDVLPEWGVTHDGSRMLFAVRTAPPPPLNVIYDWQSALPK